MAKFETLSFCQKVFSGIKLLHANVQCVYNVYTNIVYIKYQDVSVKAVKQVEFPVYALPMHLLQSAITPTELAPSP